MALHLTIAGGAYDRTAPLRDGRVRPEGVELNWLEMPPEEIFWRMMRYREFDLSELSFAGYVTRRARGVDDLVAIPVFLSRTFRHDNLYVNVDAGVERPEDLAGKRIGVPEYQITAAVWVRQFLEDDYGVRPEDVTWVQGGLETWGRKPFEPVSPEGVTIEETPQGSTLAQMLADGEIDALLTPRPPSTFVDGDRVRRLFADPLNRIRDYYTRTGIFPIMHTVAMRRELIDANPWLPQSLLKAFEQAKQAAMADLRNPTTHYISLPFLRANVAEAEELVGQDFWPYGLEANRHTLETFLHHVHRQGLISDRLAPEDLFPESTWHHQPI